MHVSLEETQKAIGPFWQVLEREPRTVIHVKRAIMFDPMG